MRASLEKIINNPNAVIFFDIDGTLTAYACSERNHNACPDDEWEDFLKKKNPYEKIQPLKIMQKWIKNKINDNPEIAKRIFICTAVSGGREVGYKKGFIRKHYPFILEENVKYVYHQEDKVIIMKDVHEQHFPDLDSKYVVMIDDTTVVLSAVQERSNYTTIHISSFMNSLDNSYSLCEWEETEDTVNGATEYLYKTECGKYISRKDETSNFTFCPFCGEKIKIKK